MTFSMDFNRPLPITPGFPVAQFEIGDYRNFVYLLTDWASRECAIVDPQEDLKPLLEAMKAHALKLTRILLTHTHFDHVAGLPALGDLFPGLPLHLHEADAHRLKQESGDPDGKLKLQFLKDGDSVALGQTAVTLLHTPGHSPGECCYYLEKSVPPALLTGDTLFIRDCGRTDLAGGSNEQMFQSLQRIKRLPPATLILPGHHYVEECRSTLQRELETSPPLRCATLAELERLP